MDLFDLPASVLPEAAYRSAVESPFARAQRRVREVIQAGHPICLAFSAGKDSSALANIVLCTAAELRAAGDAVPPIIVVNSDTGVDQPEVVTLAGSELAKMQRFAKEHDLPVRTMRGSPALTDSFAVRVIGGRGLPSFPDTRADCSNDWKIKVNEKLLKQAIKDCGRRGGRPLWS
ncbi:MAG: hypothetical protein EPN64_04650 [Burkholderiaceae bacterium]|nr:MAG: hypothetical protein EPN64_04650 [Burkholderiaceae bacterium]